MKVRFKDEDLDRLEADPDFTKGFSADVVRAFRKVMQFIRSAVDERDLYQMKSLRFKKLEGSRSHQRSLRLNDKWRLVVEIEAGEPKNTVVVIELVDYH